MKKTSTFLILFICTFFIEIKAQQNNTSKEILEKADKFLINGNTDAAIGLLKKGLQNDTLDADLYFKIGKIYESIRNQENAIYFYEKAIQKQNQPEKIIQAYTYLGTRMLQRGQYQKAKEYLSVSVQFVPKQSPVFSQISQQLRNCEFAIQAMQEATFFESFVLPSDINFGKLQYFPFISPTQDEMLFTTLSPSGDENIMLSKKIDGKWQKAESISALINSEENEGTCSISADGRTLIFTGCNKKNSLGSCDLYISRKQGKDWSIPENLGTSINSRFWEAQPSLSNDGKKLYFTSDRPGGLGNKDIWVSEIDSLGQWQTPTNLGKNINTVGNDISPFLHPNRKVLFFASDGRVGMGKYDIYLSKVQGDVHSMAENLGYPINTHEDQVGLVISSDGQKGYYSVNHNNQSKIYEFNIPSKIKDKIPAVAIIRGIIKDKSTAAPLSAKIELIRLDSQQSVETIISDSLNGEFRVILPDSGNFGLFIQKRKYLFKSIHLENITNTNKELDIALEPIKQGTQLTVENIFFEISKFDLKPDSFVALDKLSDLLKANPSLELLISGHTDNIGNEKENQILSEKRANSVMNYLVSKHVSKERLQIMGLGSSKPLAPNTNEQNRQLNRRIEIKITKIGE